MPTIDEVKKFWENNPLFSGESRYEAGSKDFFEEHRTMYLKEGFADRFCADSFFPRLAPDAKFLDLGCGVGFWPVEVQLRGVSRNVYAADLTERALELTAKRLDYYGLRAELTRQNAEAMTYPSAFFDHVNCQGVIHHTPHIDRAIAEIARVLVPGGTASVSVYYRNVLLRLWPFVHFLAAPLVRCGFGLKGRGRERMLTTKNVNEVTRLYDGSDNPIGTSYTRSQFLKLLDPYFTVERCFLIGFPSRALPFRVPPALHRFLRDHCGFLINATVRKK